jgi:hypothetical protein
MGANDTGRETNIFPYDGSGFQARAQSATNQMATNTNPTGFFVANRTSSTVVESWRNGVNLLTQASNSGGLIAFPIAVTGGIVAGGPCYTSNNQVAMASIGSSLSSTDATNFYSRLRTYMTAVGVP